MNAKRNLYWELFVLGLLIAFLVAPMLLHAADSGDGTVTHPRAYRGAVVVTKIAWTGDGTTLSTTVDMSDALPGDKGPWYLYMVKEVHGTGGADPSDHTVTITDSDGVSILVSDTFTASAYQDAGADMPNYWAWDGGNVTATTSADIGTDDTVDLYLIWIQN